MEVKLLSNTPHPVELIFASARQCYADGWVGNEWEEGEADIYFTKKSGEYYSDDEMEKLIKHVLNSGHTSVLEHVKFTFAIDGVSRALTHQLVRHRIASYSQQSQRYVSMDVEFDIDNFVIPPSIAKNDTTKLKFIATLMKLQDTYNTLIDLDIPAEDARFIIPNAAKSRIIVTMNCVALLHFFGLRSCTLAQWEIKKLSDKMLSICKEKLPIVFKNAGSRCISLGYCPESKDRCCGKYPTKQIVLQGYEETKAMKEGNKYE
jgi:thymidylate synthase (FAD)